MFAESKPGAAVEPEFQKSLQDVHECQQTDLVCPLREPSAVISAGLSNRSKTSVQSVGQYVSQGVEDAYHRRHVNLLPVDGFPHDVQLFHVCDDEPPIVFVDEYVAAFAAHVVVRNRRNHCATSSASIENIVVLRNTRGVTVVISNEFIVVVNHLIASKKLLSTSHWTLFPGRN